MYVVIFVLKLQSLEILMIRVMCHCLFYYTQYFIVTKQIHIP